MPPAKQPAARSRTFKEPAALKRFNRSIAAAEQALAELGKHTGRDVEQGARDLYKDLRTFVSSARRDSGKLARALRRDFEQTQKRLTPRSPASRSASTSARRTAKRASAARAKRKA